MDIGKERFKQGSILLEQRLLIITMPTVCIESKINYAQKRSIAINLTMDALRMRSMNGWPSCL